MILKTSSSFCFIFKSYLSEQGGNRHPRRFFNRLYHDYRPDPNPPHLPYTQRRIIYIMLNQEQGNNGL